MFHDFFVLLSVTFLVNGTIYIQNLFIMETTLIDKQTEQAIDSIFKSQKANAQNVANSNAKERKVKLRKILEIGRAHV